MPAKHNIKEIHVVCNTHWDREFRETFEITRRNLIDMMDVTIDILESDPRYSSFTLDAHAVLLEDYLEMRPHRRKQVTRLLAERRLFIGPWYTLPDSMNIGGEALVRNFLRAQAFAKSFDTKCMRAGYSPNNWGQPSQMPQIFRGFGVDSALIYRGISCHESPSEFIWVGADGSEIFGHRVARLARYNWYYLTFRPATRGVEPTDKNHPLLNSKEKPFRVADGRSRGTANFRLLNPHTNISKDKIGPALEAMLDLEGPDSSTGLFLAMHGHDMSVAHPKDPDIVAAASASLPNCDVRISNLEDFLDRLKESLDTETAVRLHGERRMNLKEGFWTYLLPCTISARTYLKVQSTLAENALTTEAEPLSCLAAALGANYPADYFDRAWKFLLDNHTHDANAGCAPDRVCEDMEYRYRQCLDIAGICTEDAMKHVAANIECSPDNQGQVHLVVFNPIPAKRDVVINAEVSIPLPTEASGIEIIDPDGQPCDYQLDTITNNDAMFVDNIWDVPTIGSVNRFSIKLHAQDLPATGYKTYCISGVETPKKNADSLSPAANILENELIRVEVQPSGTVNLLHKPTGRHYKNLNSYRDQGEAGNAWQHEPPQNDRIIESTTAKANLELINNGPLSATIRSTITMEIPKDSPDTKSRNTETVATTIDTYYTVRAGDPRLHVNVEFDNCARDHWLRAIFPSDIDTAVAHADTHFDVVERTIAHPDDAGWIERYRGTAPMHSMIDLSDEAAGLAILTTGLFEYEVFDDTSRTIAVSLVRSFPIKLQVSEERMEILPDTGVQCPGPQSFNYAIYPHSGNYIEGNVLNWANDFNCPPRAAQITPTDGKLPAQFQLLSVDGPGIVTTAMKKAEHSDELLVRLFNCDAKTQHAAISFGLPVNQVRTAQLDETPDQQLTVTQDRVELSVPAKKIVTLLIDLKTT